MMLIDDDVHVASWGGAFARKVYPIASHGAAYTKLYFKLTLQE